METKKILLIEDDLYFRKVLLTAFIRRGFEVDVVSDGREGWRRFKENRYPLVITDLVLPRLSGEEVVKKILSYSPGTSIIMVSAAFDAIKEKERLKEYGVVSFFDKPFSIDALLNEVSRILGKPIPYQKDKRLRFREKDGEITGNFKDVSFEEVLFYIYQKMCTGFLRLQQKRTIKKIYFLNGYPGAVESNLASENILNILSSYGFLSQREQKRLLAEMKQKQKTEIELLVDNTRLDKSELSKMLQKRIIAVLKPLFSWKEGEFRFFSDSSFTKRLPFFEMNPIQILYEGVSDYYDPETIILKLKRYERSYLAKTKLFDVHFEALSPYVSQSRLFDLIDGSRTLNEIIGLSDLEISRTFQILYVLLLSGMVSPYSSPQEISKDIGVTPPQKRPKEMGPAQKEMCNRIMQEYMRLKGKNYFEILGISPEASREELRRAFLKLASKYHPDAVAEISSEEIQKKAEEIFIMGKKAYDCLINSDSRKRYIASMKKRD